MTEAGGMKMAGSDWVLYEEHYKFKVSASYEWDAFRLPGTWEHPDWTTDEGRRSIAWEYFQSAISTYKEPPSWFKAEVTAGGNEY